IASLSQASTISATWSRYSPVWIVRIRLLIKREFSRRLTIRVRAFAQRSLTNELQERKRIGSSFQRSRCSTFASCEIAQRHGEGQATFVTSLRPQRQHQWRPTMSNFPKALLMATFVLGTAL